MIKASSMFEKQTDEAVFKLLQDYLKAGFRYIVRDQNSSALVLFSQKPKKDSKNKFWGYVNPDDPKALPCAVIDSDGMEAIQWTNRQPKAIDELLNIDLELEGW